ncbi:MAG: type II toxin-antitoxin system VapC family toxin [Deltaproteobacteria bacterium]|nr:type II toxin-antitoxin system VapC family toxin [Deltaproteobacteria bacterium]
MPIAILDTNIYIGHWEHGLYEETLSDVRQAHLVRHSAVVLSELRRGARTREAQRQVTALFRIARMRWEPTAADWWEAGKLVREIGDAQDWEHHKRREFQNDALIALTARRHGAIVVTDNQSDFNLLARAVGIQLLAAK